MRKRIVVAAFLLGLTRYPASAEDAVEILRSVEQRYRSAQTGEIAGEYRSAQGRVSQTRLLWRGDKWRVENDTTALVSLYVNDGEILWQYRSSKNQYVGRPTPEAGGPLRRYRTIVQDGTDYAMAGRETIRANGRRIECFVVTGTAAPGRGGAKRRQTFWIDVEERLIWRVRAEQIPSGKDRQPKLLNETENTSAKLDLRLDEDLFAFVPPRDAVRVERFRKEGDPPQEIVDILARVELAYRNLKRFHIEWSEVTTSRSLGSEHTMRKRGVASGEARYRWRWSEEPEPLAVIRVRNGRSLLTYHPRLNQYTLGESRGWAIPHPLGRFERISRGIEDARLLGSEEIPLGGETLDCNVLEVSRKPERGPGAGSKIKLWIDKESSFVRKRIETLSMEHAGEQIEHRIEQVFDVVRAGGRPEELSLELTPPDGARRVEAFDFSVMLDGGKESDLLNRPAPDFELTDAAGEPFRLSEVGGKPVLLYFWATWCGPCREVGPLVEMLSRGLSAKGLVVAGVNANEELDLVKAYQRKNGYRLRTLADDGSMQEKFGVEGLPTVLLIGADRTIRFVHSGSGLPMRKLHEALRKEGVW